MENRNVTLNSLFRLMVIFFLFISINTADCSRDVSEEQTKDISTQPDVKDMAKDILEQSGVKGGFIVHANCGDGVLTEALKKNDSYLVHGLDSNGDNVKKAREYIASKGKYGLISVDRLTGNKLPYTDNMVNLIVAEKLGDISMSEVMRVLTPNGVLMTKNAGDWIKSVKSWPEELDEWEQYLYNAGNNPVSKDTAISPSSTINGSAAPCGADTMTQLPV